MKAQYKIRLPGVSWEDTPIVAEYNFSGAPTAGVTISSAKVRAVRIAWAVEREVRWSWEGSDQGHYVGAIFSEERR